ncbi:type III pantothenate kinase [Leadbetterella byssophila]|uniref:Type III pantothenate kinase n=1 Tax=Leadbetterella byssophila (strain DSM 17132 / JCM 16389 / KACC 11308 / NBRC 106382 / 4M15) TaxID=649349 RepID=E4RZG5_LEAB4|nr:type III pantothenate kinase [Leadbetterella byssophila]ADQ17389.1 putative transcriptional acitvator, Baf family [Leadbetterella byssophila DSM 17132]
MIVFDVGNTDTVVGFFEGENLRHKFRIRSLKSENSVFFEYRILNFMLEHNIEKSSIKKAVISSVVPLLTPFFTSFCEKFLKLRALVVAPSKSHVLKINIDMPEELGSDLFLNALSAYTEHKTDCLVVDFGTALTFTLVDGQGVIQGVSIVPGLNTALKSLFSATSLLPEVRIEKPKSVVGKNTLHSIQSGIYFGYESLVRGLVQKIREEFGRELKVLATGGLSGTITELQNIFVDIQPDLTLKGMYYYGQTH